jgi:hypothetical protein
MPINFAMRRQKTTTKFKKQMLSDAPLLIVLAELAVLTVLTGLTVLGVLTHSH